MMKIHFSPWVPFVFYVVCPSSFSQDVGEELSKSPKMSVRRIKDDLDFTFVKVTNEGKIEAKETLRTILNTFYTGNRLWDEAQLPHGLYAVTSVDSLPNWKGRESLLNGAYKLDAWKIVVEAYEATFGVKIHEVTRRTKVYLLKVDGAKPEALTPSKNNNESDPTCAMDYVGDQFGWQLKGIGAYPHPLDNF